MRTTHTTHTKGDRVNGYFLVARRANNNVRISRSMDKYVYQIQGALENAAGKFMGLRILVCDLNNFDSVDVPVTILDKETAKYIQFRLNCTKATMDIAKLPYSIQNNIRAPLGRWLDQWVRENFHGDFSNRKSTNS